MNRQLSQPAPLPAKVDWLSSPGAFGDFPFAAERIETHFAYVFLTREHAYKLKKPMKIYGADLRSLAAREYFCREEIRLNLRLADDTYLQVIPLMWSQGRFGLTGPGDIVDWLVKMRRLDASEMLDARLRAGTVAYADLLRLVEHLHRLDRREAGEFGVPPSPRIRSAYVAQRLQEAIHQTARPEFGLPGEILQPLARRLRKEFRELRPLLAARAPYIREGHGDLRAEHIYLGPRIQIIDALEFDRALRILDPAEEIAMLIVDLEKAAGSWVRSDLCKAFSAIFGVCIPQNIWNFYLALRAVTRAKVAIWHLDDPGQSTRFDHWRGEACNYLKAATRYLDQE